MLEAIHLLGLARSFRSARLLPVIQYEQLACTVFGQVELAEGGHSSLGISRDRQGEFQIRIDGQNARSAAQLAEILPLQLINPDSFRLLEGAPKIRRQFLDWGVFHVEPRFMSTWQRLQKALRQRNSWLRHGTLDAASQAAWDRELCQASAEIDEYRRAYIKALKPVFERTLSELVELEGLTLSYYRGWDKERELSAVLATSLHRDQQMGHTQAGPNVLICVSDWARTTLRTSCPVVSRSWWSVPCGSPRGTWSARPGAVSVFIWWMTCRLNWTSSIAAHFVACWKTYAARCSSPV
ncbi:DNA recombination and repair protein RecF [Pseudomonas chlororaphis subsp. aurantiaca]|nr:DNA recombination and repair protein RecF [Pseudomonas chlororaphis subsp. aurantiaca]